MNWIPRDHEQPGRTGEYIVTLQTASGKRCVTTRVWFGGHWNDGLLGQVIAWWPGGRLPEPYMEEL